MEGYSRKVSKAVQFLPFERILFDGLKMISKELHYIHQTLHFAGTLPGNIARDKPTYQESTWKDRHSSSR